MRWLMIYMMFKGFHSLLKFFSNSSGLWKSFSFFINLSATCQHFSRIDLYWIICNLMVDFVRGSFIVIFLRNRLFPFSRFTFPSSISFIKASTSLSSLVCISEDTSGVGVLSTLRCASQILINS